MNDLLINEGYEVVTALSGEEGIEKLKENINRAETKEKVIREEIKEKNINIFN